VNKISSIHQSSYDTIAATYASKNAASVPAVTAAIERFMRMIPTNARVLDAGCGHGRETRCFVDQAIKTVALDLSMGMLQQTKNITSAPLVQAMMQYLPFSHNSFDAIWCNAAFLHLPKKYTQQTLEGFHNILKEKGVLFLALQAGEGEEWESISYGHKAPRFFARYSFAEGTDMILSAGFRMLYCSEDKVDARNHWLHFFATK
jgi:ubiquinone/menaquinone biosynthesis C-methylase UbiE